ncbi:unnamed protein product [Protopolystoma xenopodis]|uniref:Acyltransferase 3 domain-containing protein n=1 Tax=Protopolystoma xenopodis TaxID=117903 RepID=A0A448XGD8_9PLAT|nr:unnamed protein product [Protopolystoma xenopodis]
MLQWFFAWKQSSTILRLKLLTCCWICYDGLKRRSCAAIGGTRVRGIFVRIAASESHFAPLCFELCAIVWPDSASPSYWHSPAASIRSTVCSRFMKAPGSGVDWVQPSIMPSTTSSGPLGCPSCSTPALLDWEVGDLVFLSLSSFLTHPVSVGLHHQPQHHAHPNRHKSPLIPILSVIVILILIIPITITATSAITFIITLIIVILIVLILTLIIIIALIFIIINRVFHIHHTHHKHLIFATLIFHLFIIMINFLLILIIVSMCTLFVLVLIIIIIFSSSIRIGAIFCQYEADLFRLLTYPEQLGTRVSGSQAALVRVHPSLAFFRQCPGPVNRLLCWSGFRVLSRLSYTIYLIHPIIFEVIAYSSKQPILFDYPTWNVHLAFPCITQMPLTIMTMQIQQQPYLFFFLNSASSCSVWLSLPGRFLLGLFAAVLRPRIRALHSNRIADHCTRENSTRP